MDKITEKVTEYLIAFEAAAKAYAPQVVDVGLNVVQLKCIGTIATLLFWIIVIGFLSIRNIPKLIAAEKRLSESDYDWHPLHWFIGAAHVIPLFIMVLSLTNFWLWVGAFKPELYIAYQIMEKVIGN